MDNDRPQITEIALPRIIETGSREGLKSSRTDLQT